MTLSVKDTGAGIPADVLPTIFEPFVQADRSLQRAQGGLGIGLTLVKKIVELHGGTVEAQQRRHRAGQRVRGAAAAAARAGLHHEPAPSPRDEGELARQRVLVVDDNVDAADSLGMLLTSWGTRSRFRATASTRCGGPGTGGPTSCCSTSGCRA